MALTEADIRKVAKLSRIGITDSEVKTYVTELSKILGMVQELQAVNTTNIPQMTSVVNTSLPKRDDKVSDGDCAEDVLANAPMKEFNCFVVPKVVE